MKAFASLKRRQISTDVVEAPQPDEDSNYQSLSLGKTSRRGLHAVSPTEMFSPSDLMGVGNVELAISARDSQGVISSAATNQVLRPAFNNKIKAKRITAPMMTTDDFIQVRLATVRESTRHCFWPADVVASFTAAEIIR